LAQEGLPSLPHYWLEEKAHVRLREKKDKKLKRQLVEANDEKRGIGWSGGLNSSSFLSHF
jgi:hypothetical protein